MLLFQYAKLLASFQPIYLQELETTMGPISPYIQLAGFFSSYFEHSFLKWSNVIASAYIISKAKDFLSIFGLLRRSRHSGHSCTVPPWVLEESDGCGRDWKPRSWQCLGLFLVLSLTQCATLRKYSHPLRLSPKGTISMVVYCA